MDGIRFDVDLPAPPDRIWPILTDRRKMSAWFTETDFVPEPGRRFMLWPGPLPGIDGPISAVVLEVSEPRRLVMGWQGPHSQTTMTWTLQATRTGTQLRVHETGHLGPDAAVRERTLRRLFDVDLRTLVQQPVPAGSGGVGLVWPPLEPGSGMLDGEALAAAPNPEPSSAAEPGGSAEPERSRSGLMFSGALDTPPDVIPPPRPDSGDPTVESRRRRRSVLIGLVALLVLAAAGLWIAWPPGSADSGTRTLPGVGGIGDAPPGTSITGSAPGGQGPGSGTGGGAGGSGGQPGAGPGSTGVGSTPSGPGQSQGPGGGGTNPTGPAPQAHLSVAYSGGGTLPATLTVTITNSGDAAGDWHNVSVTLAAGLLVTPQGSAVTVTHKPPLQCFYPTAPVTSVAAGSSYQFSFTVTLSLGSILSGAPVKSIALDAASCRT